MAHIPMFRIVNREIEKYFPEYAVGNSGFCLRSKKMLSIIGKYEGILDLLRRINYFEDILICAHPGIRKYLESNGIKFAPYELAKKFSYEYDVETPSNKWFGAHATKYDGVKIFLDTIDKEKLYKHIL